MAINTDSVNKQIYDLIKKDILERRLKPGEKIDTKGIAEANGVSVMPVRDALQQLATTGLVVKRGRVGFYVRKFSPLEIAQILEMRTMFELHCMRLHMRLINKNQARQILQQLVSATSVVELDALDREIHFLSIAASNNPFLIEEYEKLSALFSLGVFGGEEANVHIAQKEHIAILTAILDEDIDLAVNLLSRHLARATEEITDIYMTDHASAGGEWAALSSTLPASSV